jgi:hypothetical protein
MAANHSMLSGTKRGLWRRRGRKISL